MIKLRHYQAGSTPAVFKYLEDNPKGDPVVALPTGAGKTYCIADLIQEIRKRDRRHKVVILSHVKEILEQNYKSLSTYLDEPIAVNSAMLGSRDVGPITVAGIQSVYTNPGAFQHFKWVIIDEAHLLSADDRTMYQKFLRGIGTYTKVGFTATPYRLGTGYIYGDDEDAAFDALCYDWTSAEAYNQLIEEGFLSPLSTKRTKLEMDTSNIKLKAGDFNESQLSAEFDREVVTNAAIKEILAAGVNRNKWLVFAIDIKHAEHIAEMLIRNGIRTAVVHSKMGDDGFDRQKVVQGMKDGKYKCIVNVNILTTGYDDPGIDLIAMLRPTTSPVLHVQSLGRGSRIQEGKTNCLVLDFAGNTARLGPINNVLVPIKGKGKGGGEPITKTCPACEEILAPAVRKCPECGHKFAFRHGLSANAGNYDIIEDGKAHWIAIDKVEYSLNSNPAAPSSVRVDYHCGNKIVAEYICIEHKGFALHKAKHWIKFRGGQECKRATELLAISNTLKVPSKILVQKKGKYHNINDARFEETA